MRDLSKIDSLLHAMDTADRDAPRSVVLNVEDSDPARIHRTRLFRSAGYQVVEASTGAEALAAATRRQISVALIDVTLPDANGIDLCDTLKRLRPELPVLLISSDSLTTRERRAGWEAGAYTYLREPLPSEVLLKGVADALSGQTDHSDADAWVLTDGDGVVQGASPGGARLLGASMRGLSQRSLVVFFERDRDGWRGDMVRAARGERVWRTGRLRPKERRPLEVFVALERAAVDPALSLRWTFHLDDVLPTAAERVPLVES